MLQCHSCMHMHRSTEMLSWEPENNRTRIQDIVMSKYSMEIPLFIILT